MIRKRLMGLVLVACLSALYTHGIAVAQSGPHCLYPAT